MTNPDAFQALLDAFNQRRYGARANVPDQSFVFALGGVGPAIIGIDDGVLARIADAASAGRLDEELDAWVSATTEKINLERRGYGPNVRLTLRVEPSTGDRRVERAPPA
jgi:hypothetical protein